MKLPHRVTRLLLLGMMAVSLALRFPTTDHEVGVDSFFIHNLATNIVMDGNAEWILSPFSFFGWYPMSYPSGGPLLIATTSQLSSQSIELTILLLSLGLGAIGVLTSFVMAHEFRDDDLLALAVSFVYAFAPRLLDFTLWSGSMRGLFVVLLPAFVWATLRAARAPSAKNFVLVLSLFLLMASVHRMAALLAAVCGALIAALVFMVAMKLLRGRFPRLLLTNGFRRLSLFLALAAFVGFAAAVLFGGNVLNEYSQGELFSGHSAEIEIMNLGVSLARSVGLVLVFAAIGLILLLRTRNKSVREAYVVLVFMALMPTLFLRQYTGFYILPFVAILGGLALAGLMKLRSSQVRRAVGAFFVVSILAFSLGVLHYEVDHSPTIPDATYSTALYLHSGWANDVVIANDGLMGVRVASFAGLRLLPIGGAGTTSQGPELLAYDFISAGDVTKNLGRVPLADLTLDTDSPWVVYAIDAQSDWVAIMQAPYYRATGILSHYHPSLYLENREFAYNLYAFDHMSPSAFAGSAHDSAYLLYESPSESVYYVQLP